MADEEEASADKVTELPKEQDDVDSESHDEAVQRLEDGWVDILENGQLLKRVVQEGDTSSDRPERGCKVTISLTTRLKSTGQVVSSETFPRLEAFVGDYDVMHGVDLMLPLMHEKEVAQAVIHDRFAYGAQGKEPDIPGHSTLDCEIHLLQVQRMDDESQLPLKDRITFGAYNWPLLLHSPVLSLIVHRDPLFSALLSALSCSCFTLSASNRRPAEAAATTAERPEAGLMHREGCIEIPDRDADDAGSASRKRMRSCERL